MAQVSAPMGRKEYFFERLQNYLSLLSNKNIKTNMFEGNKYVLFALLVFMDNISGSLIKKLIESIVDQR